jgi:hypothetical protein
MASLVAFFWLLDIGRSLRIGTGVGRPSLAKAIRVSAASTDGRSKQGGIAACNIARDRQPEE